MSKITIIGAGFVGSTTASLLCWHSLGDVVLLDRDEGIAKGKALDIKQAGSLLGAKYGIEGTANYEDTKDSNIVIITAGIPRKPGMSRDDLMKTNAEIVKSVTKQVIQYSTNCILIVVTNPLDVMAYLAWKESGFQKNRVIGMAGVLDTTRMRTFIASALNVSAKGIEAIVLGGHGDEMIPLMRHVKVDGKPINDLLNNEKIEEIVERTKKGGIEIVNYLKTGSAYFAPAASIVEMVKSIVYDSKATLPCSVYLEGEYGHKDVFIGVPVVLGKNGLEKIVELDLEEKEKQMFKDNVDHFRKNISLL